MFSPPPFLPSPKRLHAGRRLHVEQSNSKSEELMLMTCSRGVGSRWLTFWWCSRTVNSWSSKDQSPGLWCFDPRPYLRCIVSRSRTFFLFWIILSAHSESFSSLWTRYYSPVSVSLLWLLCHHPCDAEALQRDAAQGGGAQARVFVFFCVLTRFWDHPHRGNHLSQTRNVDVYYLLLQN